MINYGGRIGAYGDYSHYTSKPLHDFIYESNKGHDVDVYKRQVQTRDRFAGSRICFWGWENFVCWSDSNRTAARRPQKTVRWTVF